MANEVSTYLKYANLQMAAESLFDVQPLDLPGATKGAASMTATTLVAGNNRTNKFTPTQATQLLADGWTVVQHKSNTTTGFSGTLFRYDGETDPSRGLTKGELVVSFRSTEFIDDAARDSKATGELEIQKFGWALGQLDDMRTWYEQLTTTGAIPVGTQVDVTGYSLGGHLATAFTLLYPAAVRSTYTFNGAGVGEVASGNVAQALDMFRGLRGSDQLGFFRSNQASEFYATWRNELNGSADAARRGQALGTLTSLQASLSANPVANALALQELALLYDAVGRGAQVFNEAARVNAGIPSGSTDSPAAQAVGATPGTIAALTLDYQLAALRASTTLRPYESGVADAFMLGWSYGIDRARLPRPQGIPPIFDIYAAPPPSAVANSQHHYGQAVPVFIEDQPLWRGTFLPRTVVQGVLQFGEVKLLDDNFTRNDFGDTHSLVLIVDSLSVQSALAKLDPAVEQTTLDALLASASNARANSTSFTQGDAEFDTLERVVQALGEVTGASRDLSWTTIRPNPSGGTWAERGLVDGKDSLVGQGGDDEACGGTRTRNSWALVPLALRSRSRRSGRMRQIGARRRPWVPHDAACGHHAGSLIGCRG